MSKVHLISSKLLSFLLIVSNNDRKMQRKAINATRCRRVPSVYTGSLVLNNERKYITVSGAEYQINLSLMK